MKDGFEFFLKFIGLIILAPLLFFIGLLIVAKGPMFGLLVLMLLIPSLNNKN